MTSRPKGLKSNSVYEKRGLERLLPKLRFWQFGDKRPLPKRSGKTIQWFRYRRLSVVTSNMTELTVPSQVSLSADTITATIVQRGAYSQFSDLLDMTAIDNVIESASDIMGEQAAESVDRYIQEQVFMDVQNNSNRSSVNHATAAKTGAGSKVWSGTSAEDGFMLIHNKTLQTRSASIAGFAKTALSVRSVLDAVRYLRKNDVPTFPDGSYVGIIHPDVAFQLLTNDAWKSWNQYTTPEKMFMGEIGAIGGVRFVESSALRSYDLSGDTFSTASGTLYGTLIVGQHAYGVTEIGGGDTTQGFRMYLKTPGPHNTNDPVDQKSTVGWKMTMASRILNKTAGCIVLSTSET